MILGIAPKTAKTVSRFATYPLSCVCFVEMWTRVILLGLILHALLAEALDECLRSHLLDGAMFSLSVFHNADTS
jgi:hypothetical protein